MRDIFNRFSTLLSPTKQLHAEIKRFARGEDELPSIEKVRSLIGKDAKVNAVVDHFTALSQCAYEYSGQLSSAKATEQGRQHTWVNGREITPEDRRGYANRFLEVAKVLVEAGADPRAGEKFPNGEVDPSDNAMNWLNANRADPALVKDFKDLLVAAEAAAVKRDANKPKSNKSPKNWFKRI